MSSSLWISPLILTTFKGLKVHSRALLRYSNPYQVYNKIALNRMKPTVRRDGMKNWLLKSFSYFFSLYIVQ